MKERIMFAQDNESWCGVACLAEALYRRKNKIIPQEELAGLLGTTKENGTSQKQMLEGAIKLGLQAKSYFGISLDQLQEMVDDGYIVILNWMSGRNYDEDGHYCILEEVMPDLVTLNDPEFIGSIRKVRRTDFEKFWFDIEVEEGRVDKMALVVI